MKHLGLILWGAFLVLLASETLFFIYLALAVIFIAYNFIAGFREYLKYRKEMKIKTKTKK